MCLHFFVPIICSPASLAKAFRHRQLMTCVVARPLLRVESGQLTLRWTVYNYQISDQLFYAILVL